MPLTQASSTKKRPKKRKRCSDAGTESAEPADPDLGWRLLAKIFEESGVVRVPYNPQLSKFWHRRYSLFSNFDDGIALDAESWFSVTPELIAAKQAKRCVLSKNDVVLDGFCGAGGNAIALARICRRVIAVDVDASKLALARHNASLCGVLSKIRFVQGEFTQVASQLTDEQCDAVFLSPPWGEVLGCVLEPTERGAGGPSYLEAEAFDLSSIDAFEIHRSAASISQNVAHMVPRHTDRAQLQQVACVVCWVLALYAAQGCVQQLQPGSPMVTQDEYLNDKLQFITVYFGALATAIAPAVHTRFTEQGISC